MSNLPKGFYTGPDGRERFWDGTDWHESSQVAPPKKRISIRSRFGMLSKRSRVIAAILALIVVLGVAGGVTFRVVQHNTEVALQAEAAAKAAAAEKAAKKAAQEAADRAAAAEAADLERRRANRKDAVIEIEASVRSMAEEHSAEGILDGSVLSVNCTPTGGVSIDDISIRSMLFECFVATQDNGDGTMSGSYYHALADWDDGSWTYGPGRG